MSLHRTACHCMSLHVTACHCMSRYVTACNCIYGVPLHVTARHCNYSMSLHVIALHCMSLYVVACQCLSRNVTACHCMSLHVNACRVCICICVYVCAYSYVCLCVHSSCVRVCARTCVRVHAWLCGRRAPRTRNRRDHRKGQTSNTLDHNIPIVTMVIDEAKRRSQGSNFMHTLLRNAPLEPYADYTLCATKTLGGEAHAWPDNCIPGGCPRGRRGEGRTGFWMNDSTHFPRVRTRPLATTSLLAARHETPVRLSRETDTPAAPEKRQAR